MSDSTALTTSLGLATYDYAIDHFDGLRALAETIAKSGMMPKDLRTPEATLAVLLTGRELGLGPMEAARSLHYVEGRVVMAADAQHARALRGGVTTRWVVTSDSEARLELSRNGQTHVSVYTIEMAKRAGLASRPNWQRHPEAMLRARAITAGIRAFCPDVLGSGVYSPDEAEDIRASARQRDEGGVPERSGSKASVEIVDVEVVDRPKPLAIPDALTVSQLEEVFRGMGIVLAEFDAFRAAKQKPPVATLTDEQRAAAAKTYRPGPARSAYDKWVAETRAADEAAERAAIQGEPSAVAK